ncbi:IST1 homolog [Cloeon dipterum]|uniref:IST1 homolog n=1 Tax=Cloeon dipterum TaxID=197152 RepID=UPI00322037EA
MFSSGPNYVKLKTHLRLAINRLKLLEKKKTELAQKARKEIADYIAAGKAERAKIRVEQIIREDYLVEAMEIVEMYCDLLIARYGLVQQMKTLDEGLAEAISSLIWVAPRLQTDVAELKVISEQLTAKYGKQYNQACREEAVGTISEKLKHKLSVQAPPKLLVEKYLIEIAKIYNVPYEPDPQVMMNEDTAGLDALLIDLNNEKNNLGGGGSGGGGGGGGGMPQPPGFIGFPQPPALPSDFKPFSYPSGASGSSAASGPAGFVAPPLPNVGPNAPNFEPHFSAKSSNLSYNIPPDNSNASASVSTPTASPKKALNTDPQDEPPPPYTNFPPDVNTNKGAIPKPAPRAKMPDNFDLPELPSVPSDEFPAPGSASLDNDEIDFDDLTRRFEDLKKKT